MHVLELIWYLEPTGHEQLNVPMVFVHTAWSPHTSVLLSVHSSRSEIQNSKQHGLITWTLIQQLVYDKYNLKSGHNIAIKIINKGVICSFETRV